MSFCDGKGARRPDYSLKVGVSDGAWPWLGG